MFDYIIRNALIYDGLGNLPKVGNIGIKNGVITLDENEFKIGAIEEIDADGRVLSPGFIDMHAHYDFVPFVHSSMDEKLLQGVTTQIGGVCGYSVAPVNNDTKDMLDNNVSFLKSGYKGDLDWNSFSEYLDRVSEIELGTNLGFCVGHGTIRIAVMGFSSEKASDEQINAMKILTEEALKEGAMGLSMGLIYPPGVFADEKELIEVAGVLKKFDAGVYIHLRNESDRVVEAVEEAIKISVSAGVPVQIHHHKAVGKKNWGKVKTTVSMIKEARERGHEITADLYPYIFGGTNLKALLPPWALEGGFEAMIQRLSDKKIKEQIIFDVENSADYENIYLQSGSENIILLACNETPEFMSKSLEEISRILNCTPVEAAIHIISKNKGLDKMAIYFGTEENLELVLAQEFTMIGSDSNYPAPGSNCHPRVFGTFPRYIKKYVLERKIVSMEEMIRKMTSFPAKKFNLLTKGIIADGMDADLIIFKPNNLKDNADLFNPTKLAEGMDYVFVGGKLAIKEGKITGVLNGKVIRKGDERK